jgi:hypothetical protein
MRLIKINLLALALVVFSASIAGAYQLRLEENSGDFANATAGSLLTVDVFLDTEGQSSIVLLGVGVQTNNSQLAYTGAPLNVIPNPGILLDFGTFTWLAKTPAWGNVFPGSPAGFSRVTVDFAAASFTPTTATGDNILLATLQYEVLADGNYTGAFDFQYFNSGTFELAGGVTIIDDVVPQNNVVPEPTTALLVGIGLAGLGYAGRRRD